MSENLSNAVKSAVEAERNGHSSDCAVHNEPAFPNGPCDCGYSEVAAIRSRSSAPPVPAPIDEAAERTTFEEWARPYGYQRDRNEHGVYVYWIMRDTWSAWLARARLGRA